MTKWFNKNIYIHYFDKEELKILIELLIDDARVIRNEYPKLSNISFGGISQFSVPAGTNDKWAIITYIKDANYSGESFEEVFKRMDEVSQIYIEKIKLYNFLDIREYKIKER